ncbi:MHC class II regulatory factor RFX1 [Hypsibius exemplaris]|uniref:MHC class II regulatory factor RFX1 n=2 Tax=Hypsibius TaxID=58670 RepID=A0A1W0XEQ5_HYPEX|nr:putative MHC class II regulatory factor RFX1 [Hypsibius dujardini]OQV25959.1 MHC class II regulatory factor RFX1 [Hypsibius exemplaris]
MESNLSSVETSQIAVTIRANPRTVEWLMDNFELAEGMTMPRSTVFHHYVRHCRRIGIEQMNQATFGKVIRSVFPAIRSRRLGTRGQSRYHYYGLRINLKSPLLAGHSLEEGALRSKPGTNKRRKSVMVEAAKSAVSSTSSIEDNLFEQQTSQTVAASALQLSGHEFDHLGADHAAVPERLFSGPEWGRIDRLLSTNSVYPLGSPDLCMFRDAYRRHCQAVLEAVLALRFSAIEGLWSVFWRARYDEEEEKALPFAKFYPVISCTAMQDHIIEIDVEFFGSLTTILIPDVLRPIPSSLTQVIRNFAKSMEGWVRESMVKMPKRLVHHKLLAANALAHALKRNTSLNHLAQAARTVLTNPAQTSTMLADLSRLDICSIHEQGSLMCPCEFPAMKRFADEFKLLLADSNICERWPAWIDKVVDFAMGAVAHHTSMGSVSQEFCQKWSYFSSLAIRDLTLRSAVSFGSFHLIRLLFDEYVVYALEKRTAKFANVSALGLFFNHLMNLYPLSETDYRNLGRPSHISTGTTTQATMDSAVDNHRPQQTPRVLPRIFP